MFKSPLAGLCAAALAAAFFSGPAFAAPSSASSDDGKSLEQFQARVNQIAAEHNRPPVAQAELGLGSDSDNTAERNKVLEQTKKLPPIERIIDMGINKVRAVKAKDGTIMYIADNGRFVFMGKVFDLWQKKPLETIEEISDAVSRIHLGALNFNPQEMNLARLGTGEKHVTIFVDPLCGWCHKLMGEIDADKSLLKDYTFDFIAVGVLGEASESLAKRLYCSQPDAAKRFEALKVGRSAIEALSPVAGNCNASGFERSQVTLKLLGIQAVPFVIAPDGRFARGKPRSIREFLSGSATDGGHMTVQTRP